MTKISAYPESGLLPESSQRIFYNGKGTDNKLIFEGQVYKVTSSYGVRLYFQEELVPGQLQYVVDQTPLIGMLRLTIGVFSNMSPLEYFNRGLASIIKYDLRKAEIIQKSLQHPPISSDVPLVDVIEATRRFLEKKLEKQFISSGESRHRPTLITPTNDLLIEVLESIDESIIKFEEN